MAWAASYRLVSTFANPKLQPYGTTKNMPADAQCGMETFKQVRVVPHSLGFSVADRRSTNQFSVRALLRTQPIILLQLWHDYGY
jgi:hypothetical protein